MAVSEYLKYPGRSRDRLQEFWDFLIFPFGDVQESRSSKVRSAALTSLQLPEQSNRKQNSRFRKSPLPLAGSNLTIETKQMAYGSLTIEDDDIEDTDIAYARVQIRKIAQRLVSTISRNRRHSSRKLMIDFRASMRRSIQTGGVIIDLKYKTRVINKPRLIIILDTSGSMQMWIKMLIQLIQAIGMELSKKEIFIFAADLECVTQDLGRTWQDTVSLMQLHGNWGGTTDITRSLMTLQQDFHDKFTPQTVVMMLSDLFTTEPKLAAEEVRKIARRTKSFYIFRASDHEMMEEVYINYYETYVRPFVGCATAVYEIDSLASMAAAVRNVCVRQR